MVVPGHAGFGYVNQEASDVAATVLVFNGSTTLPRVLDNLGAQTVRPGRVIAVDNGSVDESPNIIQHSSLVDRRLLLPDNQGVGAAHAIAWRTALDEPATRFVWVLEHDTIVNPDCLERLLEGCAFLESRGEIVGALLPRLARDEREARAHFSREPGTEPRPDRGLTFNGVLIARTVIDAVGYPREDFFVGHEDRDFARRIGEAGFGIWRVPRALALHTTKGNRRYGLRPSPTRSYYSTRNSIYIQRHLSPERVATFKIVAWSAASMLKILAASDQKWKRIRARAVATLDGLRGHLGPREYTFMRPPRATRR